MANSPAGSTQQRERDEERFYRHYLALQAQLRAYQLKLETLERKVHTLTEKQQMKDVYQRIIQHEE